MSAQIEYLGWEIRPWMRNGSCDCGGAGQTYNVCSGQNHTWTVAAWNRCHDCVVEFTSTHIPGVVF